MFRGENERPGVRVSFCRASQRHSDGGGTSDARDVLIRVEASESRRGQNGKERAKVCGRWLFRRVRVQAESASQRIGGEAAKMAGPSSDSRLQLSKVRPDRYQSAADEMRGRRLTVCRQEGRGDDVRANGQTEVCRRGELHLPRLQLR